MVVNGVPVRKDRHVEPVASMALDILGSVKELRDPTTGTSLTVSIGTCVRASVVYERTCKRVSLNFKRASKVWVISGLIC